jgi:hypothetical protein
MRGKKKKKKYANISYRRNNIFLKRLTVLVIELLGVIVRRLLGTHVIDCSILGIKEIQSQCTNINASYDRCLNKE